MLNLYLSVLAQSSDIDGVVVVLIVLGLIALFSQKKKPPQYQYDGTIHIHKFRRVK